MEMQPLANPAMIGRTFGGGAAALAGTPMARENAYTRTMLALQSGLNQRAHAGLANQQTQDLQAAEAGIQRLGDPSVQAQLDSYTGQPGAGAVLYHLMRAGKLSDADSIAKAAQVIQGLHMRTTAQTQGQAGNLQGMNVDLAAASGKPVKLGAVEGNTALNPFSGQIGAPTAVGGSVIGKNNASAGLDVARADTQRMEQHGTMPARPRAASAPGTLSETVLNAFRLGATVPANGVTPSSVDPAKYRAEYNAYNAALARDPTMPQAQAVQIGLQAAAPQAAAPTTPTVDAGAPSGTAGSDTSSLLPHILHMIMGGAQGSSAPAPKAPTKGDVEGGYRFMGGEPSDPKNWKKI